MQDRLGTTLLVATHNAGKLREIEELVKPFGVLIESAATLGLIEPEETGTSFEENAYIKAYTAAKATGLPALADDSGLVIDILDGAPGVYSADWAINEVGERDFAMAIQKILSKMQARQALSTDQRTARFVCVLCLAWPDGQSCSFKGQCEGQILFEPQGNQGFGYDPIFRPLGYEQSFGEMTSEQKHGWRPGNKHELSHRARAFKMFAESVLKRHD